MQSYQNVQLRFKYFYLNPSSGTVVKPVALAATDNLMWKIRAANSQVSATTVTSDYSYISIYDGPTVNSPLLIHLTSIHNDFSKNLLTKTFNSRSNSLLVVYHSIRDGKTRNISSSSSSNNLLYGFNMTYQIKGASQIFQHFYSF